MGYNYYGHNIFVTKQISRSQINSINGGNELI